MPRRISLLLLGLGLALGCATPVGVRQVDEQTVQHTLTTNVLSRSRPSDASRQVLMRLGLFGSFEEFPVATLAALHAVTLEDMEPSRLFALAEYSFLHAERTGIQRYFVAAFLYSYAFLFPEDGSPWPDAFDPRLRTAVDLYNRALAAALVEDDGEVALEGGSYPFHLGTIELRIDEESLYWADHRLTGFVSAAELDVRGLRNRYRRTGIGAPFVARLEPVEGLTVQNENARLADDVAVPVTFFLRLQRPREALRAGRWEGTLETFVEEAATHVEVAGRRVPLEFETSSALAYTLEGSRLWSFSIAGFRSGDLVSSDEGLLMVRPHRPGRIPVVLVHGTASNPARWAEMLNELASDPRIGERYEFWLFLYATGNPIPYSARRLRETLRGVVQELDPDGRDPALRRMVVIGHSQGGLLTKLQAVASGDRLWQNLSDRPFDEVKLEPETRELLGSLVFFEPLPFVERVVFISTPHRGSFLAGNILGRVGSALFTAPQNLVGVSLDLARRGIALPGSGVDAALAGMDALQGDEDAQVRRRLRRVPSSIDHMDPDSAFLAALADLRFAPHVTAHSIIPVRGDPPPEGQHDGVVEFEAARVDGVESELVVFRSGHSTQSDPRTIQEVRRILLQHLEAAGGSP
ncbi:MAG: alpha/beta fold hydrolase [Myxococcota bacterium]|nr:alpha/beta fold hydrolase [Myxococcota bacterium]